jgi:hypothetical protein
MTEKPRGSKKMHRTLGVRVSEPFFQALNKTQWLKEKKVSDIVREAILEYWDNHLNEKEKKVIRDILGEAPELQENDS